MSEDVPYAIVKKTKEYGIVKPEDRLWKYILRPDNKSEQFYKYTCGCVKMGLELVMKPYMYIGKGKKVLYYIGQCKRCEKIYWSYE